MVAGHELLIAFYKVLFIPYDLFIGEFLITTLVNAIKLQSFDKLIVSLV